MAGSWARWRPSSRAASIMSNMLGLPCLLLVVRAGPLPPGTFSIGRRRRNARKADDQSRARRAGYWTKLRRITTRGPPARNRPRRARTARPQRSRRTRRKAMDPRQACLDCLAQEPPALFEAACGSPRSTSRRIRPPTPCASSTNSSGRSAPAWTTAPRPASAPRAAANERTGFLRRRRLPLQPRSALLPLVLQRRQGQPLSLALVAMELARRLDIPLVGVNFRDASCCACRRPTICSTRPPDGASIPRLPRTAAALAGRRASCKPPTRKALPGNPPASVAQPATTAQRRRRAAGRAGRMPSGDRTRPGGRRRPRGPRRLYRQLDCPQAETLRPGTRALAQRRSHRATAPRPAPGRIPRPGRPVALH